MLWQSVDYLSELQRLGTWPSCFCVGMCTHKKECVFVNVCFDVALHMKQREGQHSCERVKKVLQDLITKHTTTTPCSTALCSQELMIGFYDRSNG